jgi:hypothetical protein
MASTVQLELPCGFVRNGEIIRRVEIRKMKGRIQRDIARMQGQKKNAAAIIDMILHQSIVALGEEKPTLGQIQDLLLADRDWLQ